MNVGYQYRRTEPVFLYFSQHGTDVNKWRTNYCSSLCIKWTNTFICTVSPSASFLHNKQRDMESVLSSTRSNCWTTARQRYKK